MSDLSPLIGGLCCKSRFALVIKKFAGRGLTIPQSVLARADEVIE